MSEDMTGSLTDESTTVTSSLMRRVLTAHEVVCHSLKLGAVEDLMIAFDSHSHADIVLPSAGDIVSVYRKSHLFDVELPEKGVSLKESAFTIPGPSLMSPIQTPIGKVSFLFITILTKLTYKYTQILYIRYFVCETRKQQQF